MTNVLIAYADTGGGHRAAASALRAALLEHGHTTTVTLVDPLAVESRSAPGRIASLYPHVVQRAPWLWHAGFEATNSPRRMALAHRLARPFTRHAFQALAARHAPDAIVSTHPLLTTPLRRAFPQVPIVVVVTDLVSGHASWYDQAADHLIVPTAHAHAAAVRCGIPSAALSHLGVPVSRAFAAVPGERAALQRSLGWATDRATVLLAGGAEGVGTLEALAVAIDRAQLPCDIAVVTGRNTALADRLARRSWQGVVHIYGFVANFADMMRAAAMLVTKAGPGTISEACASGCPLILSGAIPGQETGNVDYVVAGHAGIWAPSPLAVTAAMHAWLVGRDAPTALRIASMAALRLARPNAASDAAAVIRQVAEAARHDRAPDTQAVHDDPRRRTAAA
ncbi:MAG: hypothetical protein IT355_11485 [Gemmatimonadaceae bacterium]|nr:hypothetical protein [Gemmatimonadaceae bacterium]